MNIQPISNNCPIIPAPPANSLFAIERRELMVYGTKPPNDFLKYSLSELPFKSIFLRDFCADELERSIQKVKAVVFDLPCSELKESLSEISRSRTLSNLPIHVIVPKGFDDNDARALYKRGVCSVSSFPEDFQTLKSLVLTYDQDTLAVHSRVEARIKTTLKTRLRSFIGSKASKFKLLLEGGVVHVFGSFSMQPNKGRLQRILERTYGIEKAVVEDMNVQNLSLSTLNN